MANYTTKLKLFKWDTTNSTDLNSELEIDKTLNDNWDKIENAVVENSSDIATNLGNITQLQSNVSTNAGNISQLQTYMTNAQADIITNASDITQLQSDVSSNTNAITGLGTIKANASDVYTKTETDNLLAEKVDKENGKGLSQNDFTNTYKIKLDGLSNYDDSEIRGYITTINSEQTTQNTAIDNLQSGKANASDVYTKTESDTLLSAKVDKVTGKVLTTNDFTDTYKNKLDNLSNYDDTQIQSDIASLQSDVADLKASSGSGSSGGSVDAYTKTQTDTLLSGKVDKVTGKGLSTNDFTDTYKNKLDGLTNDFSNAYKTKLDGLSNYDDTEIRGYITTINSEQTTQNTAITALQNQATLIKQFSIATTDWNLNSATNEYEAIITDNDISSNSVVNIYFDKATISVAEIAEVEAIVTEGTGQAVLYSGSVPSEAVSGKYTIERGSTNG